MSRISVVVGAQNAKSTIEPCLRSILDQTKDLDAEILVADSSTDGTRQIVSQRFPAVKLIEASYEKLVPHLWGMGMQEADSPIVALTNAHCIPRKDWIKNILSAAQTAAQEDDSISGWGGPIAAPTTNSAKDWAVYFSRYSAFMPPAQAHKVKDVPGDNAAYTLEALERCWKQRENGFWETLFHHEVINQGGTILMTPSLEVELGKTDSAWSYFKVRYAHGRHYGSTRPNTGALQRFLRILTAPLLMPYLVLRIGKRVSEKRPDWLPNYLRATPWLLYFMSAWVLGEIRGYMSPQR